MQTETSNIIDIVEVGPRDGLQSEQRIVPTATKAQFIQRAIDSGLRRIEVASFAHPKKVPQRSDAEALVSELPDIDEVSYIGLVMNQRVLEGEPTQLGIADSMGVAVPSQVRELILALKDEFDAICLRGHFHNTRNIGIANAQAAIETGIDSLDASIGGIGGCPFAPSATGNIPTDDLLYLLNRSGIKSGVSLEEVIETSDWLALQLEHAVPAMLPKAGIFPALRL